MIGERKDQEASVGRDASDHIKLRPSDLIVAGDDGLRAPGILLADEEGLILAVLKIELQLRGFAVWLATDTAGALGLYRGHHEEIDLVLLGIPMAGLDSPRVLAALREFAPQLLVCFMARDLQTYTEAALLACGASRIFYKPFHPAEVAHFLNLLVAMREAGAILDTTATGDLRATLPRRCGHAPAETY